jgi:hypothetical protein
MTSRSILPNHIKTILAAAVILSCAAQAAVAGSPTVRDHRGANGAPEGGVTVKGAKARLDRPAHWAARNARAVLAD